MGCRECRELYRQLLHYSNESLRRRRFSSTLTGSEPPTAFRITSLWTRKNGLYSISSRSVDGILGKFLERRMRTAAILSRSTTFDGSTLNAKRRFDSVYLQSHPHSRMQMSHHNTVHRQRGSTQYERLLTRGRSTRECLSGASE